MSQENVDVVKAAYVALATGGVERFADYWAEDIEWQTMRAAWYGKRAGQAYLQELLDLFDDFTTEVVESSTPATTRSLPISVMADARNAAP